jgi:hypothetical protein
MTYYIFIEDGKINGAGQCEQLTKGILSYEVSEEVFNNYHENFNKYVFSEGKIIENPNYEAEKEQQQKQARMEEIYEELDALDIKRVRAICENEVKDTQSGETWLEYYNNQVTALREELQNLKNY